MAYNKEYYLKNRIKILEQHKAHHRRYSKHYAAYKRAWLKRDPLSYSLRSTLYRIRNRCRNPSSDNFKYYGGRGIKCFLEYVDLVKLWERDKGWNLKRPSIDRMDNDGDYVFENCRFIEVAENIARRNREHKISETTRRKMSLAHMKKL